MKKKKFLLLFIFIIFKFITSFADERKNQLNKLFKELKINNSEFTFEVEQKIWKIWSTHPQKNKLTLMLSEGSDLVKKINLMKL